MAGKVLAIIALAAVVGFMGCPTTTEEEDEPENLAGIVRIDGEPSTGNSLTVNTQWVINKTGDPAYLWKRGDQASGPFTAISGSTGASYTVAAGDDGKYIQVTVSYSGNEGDLSSDPLGPVGLPRLGGTVSITGTLKIGETLTADITGLSGQSGDLTYVWERGDGNYQAITGADANTYVITAEDAGTFIRVKVSSSGNAGDIISEARGQIPVPLTANITFAPTQSNTASTAQSAWEGEGASQTWTLTAIDQSPVYFTVQKTEEQIITVSGTDAAKVSQAAIGQTVDGSTAAHNLGVFGVNVGDLLFEGTGTKEFTLHISELGKASRAVAVSLNIIPLPQLKTGVAVFKVLEDPTPKIAGDEILERIQGIKHFDMDAMAFESASTSIATNLLDALAWIDRNAEAQGDYLVRVEQDEALPLIRLSCLYQEVKIRLRGDSQERKVTYNDFPNQDNLNTYAHKGWYYHHSIAQTVANPSSDAFITIGAYGPSPDAPPPVRITLQLEDRITLQGKDKSEYYREILYVNSNCTLIMLDGSTITGHISSNLYSPVIHVFGKSSSSLGESGYIYMYGGAIKDNSVIVYDGSNPTGYGLIYYTSGAPTAGNGAAGMRKNGTFVKEGGSITGNIDDNGDPCNMVNLGGTTVTIKEDRQYSLPPIPVEE
jgi:hypothetical protein